MKKIPVFVGLFFLLFPITVLAKTYNVTNLYVEAEIDEENIYNITEYYNVYFEENTSFKKLIPLQQDVYTSSGKKVHYITEVTDIKTEDTYIEDVTSKFHTITFEKEAKDTNTTYLLTYKYNMGNDKDKKADVIFFPLVDIASHSSLDQMSFSVTVKNIEALDNVRFYLDDKDITEKISYQVSHNVVTGVLTKELFQGEKLSLQVVLPNGYFKNTETTVSYIKFLYVIFPILIFGFTFFVFKKYRFHKKIDVDITAFDSLEIAYLYRGKIRVIDVISVVFHLANDGYLTIKNYGSGDRVQYKLIKEKDYDKNNAGEKIVFDGLFQNKEEVDAESIDGIFSPYLEDIRQIIEDKKHRQKIFYPNVKKYKNILSALFLASAIISQIDMFYYLFNTYLVALPISIIVGGTLFIFLRTEKFKKYYIPYIILLVLLCIGIYTLWNLKINLIVYAVSLILFMISVYLYSQISIRTEYGEAVLNEIEAFKKSLFMNEAMIENHVAEDSNYVYKMLPYTAVFGLTSWWLQTYGKYVKEKPIWYSSSEPYSPEKLAYCLEKIASSLSLSMQTNKRLTDELLSQAPNKLL